MAKFSGLISDEAAYLSLQFGVFRRAGREAVDSFAQSEIANRNIEFRGLHLAVVCDAMPQQARLEIMGDAYEFLNVEDRQGAACRHDRDSHRSSYRGLQIIGDVNDLGTIRIPQIATTRDLVFALSRGIQNALDRFTVLLLIDQQREAHFHRQRVEATRADFCEPDGMAA